MKQVPKRVSPETGRVEADYYIGDIKYQEQLLAQMTHWMPMEMQFEAFRRMRKRLKKHFGLISKFDGKGNLREV